MTAILCLPDGSRPELLFKSKPGSVKSEDIIAYLKELKKHAGRRKLLLFWDGLPAHRSKLVKEYLKYQANWLKIERFPAYSPELNPVEYCWSSFKNKDLCNLEPDGHFGLKRAIRRGCRRIKNNRQLLKGFIKASGLIDYST